jgi:hypothetical protein
VKSFMLILALVMSALLAVPATAQTDEEEEEPSPVPTVLHQNFNVAEAYPCTASSYPTALGIADLRVFTGQCPPPPEARGATPGIISLRRRGLALDVNCFAVIPAGQVGPCFVQSFQLIKTVPGSIKCPDVYTAASYVQFGVGVRTWWSLNFTQPGTRFILTVISVCRARSATGVLVPRFHRDTWTWLVEADVNTLLYVIELMHSGAVSTLEIVCIIGEDMYDALLDARQRLADAIPTQNRTLMGNAIFDMEALIVANCLFVDTLNPHEAFPGQDQFGARTIQPPGNPAPTVRLEEGGTAVAGIIDTTEHPCCCKLIVDLEWIARKLGLTR